MIVHGHGMSVDLPRGWEGRIFKRRHGEPTLHAATFALPFDDGEFGTRSTKRMPAGGAFVTITEYRPGNGLVPGRGLYEPRGLPLPIERGRFRPNSLLVARRGQRGFQHFFTEGGRAFCLYAVLHEERLHSARRGGGVDAVNGVLESVAIDAR